MKDYIGDLVVKYPSLKPCVEEIRAAVAMVCESVKKSGKVLTCGNGGSAADAEHIVGELMKGFLLKRVLSGDEMSRFEKKYQGKGLEIARNLQRAVPAMALTGNVSLSTAFANDVNPEFVFAQQVYGLGNAGDVLICLSTSGNSRNVVLAAMVARTKDIKVISLTGEDGGELKNHSDITIRVPSSKTMEIQEYHLPVYHTLCAQIEENLFGSDSNKLK